MCTKVVSVHNRRVYIEVVMKRGTEENTLAYEVEWKKYIMRCFVIYTLQKCSYSYSSSHHGIGTQTYPLFK
jgi:translation initiation factor 2 alpha subunit (eIF-2alpha)